MPTRRDILIGSATLPLLASGAVAATADELWPEWQAEWRRMEGIARARQWKVTPIRIARPVTPRRLKVVERTVGLPFPTQLRELMLRFSGKVAFGWNIPGYLWAFDGQGIPTSSGPAIWDIDSLSEDAVPNFQGMKQRLRNSDYSEAPNRPEMWENQFPIANVGNGDVLTIDVTNRDGPQPVRYFSDELEGLHGAALAPDFHTFVSVLSKLGWAGSGQDDWFSFLLPQEGDRRYFSTETEGAKRWASWLARDPASPPSDEPPMALAVETQAERALLAAAEIGSLPGVREALAVGARPDVVLYGNDILGKWECDFATALTHAVRRDDLDMAKLLVSHGARLNLRRLAVNEAVGRGNLETLRWTLEQGGRVNGWRFERHHPIHTLLGRRIDEEERMRGWERSDRESGREWTAGERAKWKPIDEPTALAMLDLLIAAGADVDARWDSNTTMLMVTKSIPAAKRLLAAGARVDLRDSHGSTVMHEARSPAKLRLLVAAGADVNAISTPGPRSPFRSCTPLQYHLDKPDMRETLLDLGADPRIRDGKGQSTLAWCDNVGVFERMRGFGLEPLERLADGGTFLIHYMRRGTRLTEPGTLAMIDHLLSLGIGINEQTDKGQTVLHELAERGRAKSDEVRLLLARGADKDIRDKEGWRPFDLAEPSATELREALR